jgi:hypothetical protein
MIFKNKKNIQALFYLKKSVSVFYYYGKIVYQSIRSCFGSGTWRSDRPWLGKDLWKNK